MNFKTKKKTKMTSLRIEEDVLKDCKRLGINISYACNLFLKSYLYIQKYDPCECPLIGSHDCKDSDIAIDIYNRRKLLY